MLSVPLMTTSHYSIKAGSETTRREYSENNETYTKQTRSHLKKAISSALVSLMFIYTVLVGFRAVKNSNYISSLSSWSICHGKGNLRAGTHRNFSSLPTHYTLPSGDRIPSIALGVWKAEKGQVEQAVKKALQVGYRHIDDAWIYRNEKEVGQAIKESSVPRSDIWITSKLWNNFHAPEDVEPALDESLQNLGTDYLDLYLIHWPIAFKKDPGPNGENIYDRELSDDPYPTWKKLEEMVEKGKVRNIGISNFNIRRIQNLTANPLKIKPAVLQVELNYYNPQPELIKWARENGLVVEAYSPLGSSSQVGEMLRLPQIKKIADALGITPAQAVISWHLQRGTVVLPKSVTPSRIEENYEVVTLPEDLFNELETAATSHPPERVVNPSRAWGLDFDIFYD